MTIFGIDVARYQGAINWPAVAGAGMQFATIKASEGSEGSGFTAASTRDYFRNHLPKAAAALPLVGGYHVIRSEPVGPQVTWFLKQLARVGDPSKMIHQLDYEKWDYDFPAYSYVKAFVAEHRRQTGGHPLIVYCGKWIWDQVPGKPANAAQDLGVAGLWNSRYVAGPASYQSLWGRVPASWWGGYGGWAQASILQYSSTARVNGVPGNVDANAYRGTIAELTQLLTGERIEVEGDDDMKAGDKVQMMKAAEFGSRSGKTMTYEEWLNFERLDTIRQGNLLTSMSLRMDEIKASVAGDREVTISPATITALVGAITDGVVSRLDVDIDEAQAAAIKAEVFSDLTSAISTLDNG